MKAKILLGSFIITIIYSLLIQKNLSFAFEGQTEYTLNLTNTVCVTGGNVEDKIVETNTDMVATPIQVVEEGSSQLGFNLSFTGNDFNTPTYLKNNEQKPGYYYTVEVMEGSRWGNTIVEEQYVGAGGVTQVLSENFKMSTDSDTQNYTYIIRKYEKYWADQDGSGSIEDVEMGDTGILVLNEKGRCATHADAGTPIPENLVTLINNDTGETTKPVSNTQTLNNYCTDPDIYGPNAGTVGLDWEAMHDQGEPDAPVDSYYLKVNADLSNAASSEYENARYEVVVENTDTGTQIWSSGQITKDQGGVEKYVPIDPTTESQQNNYSVKILKTFTNPAQTDTTAELEGCSSTLPISVDSQGKATEIEVEEETGIPSTNAESTFTDPSMSSAQAEDTVQKVVSAIYIFVFPIAVVVAIIKLLLSLLNLATSQGDPQRLQQAKEDILATLIGLVVVGGAVTLVNILGSTIGL
jgi:hypothetical protein